MRWSIIVFTTTWVGLASMTRAQDPAADDAKRLQGAWKLVALESDGRKATAQELESLKNGGWTFEGTEVTFSDPGASVKSMFKLDPGKTPREIDLIGRGGPQEGKTLQGIYRLEGGTLTICVRDFASSGKGRPREFATAPGSESGLIVLERSKP